MFYNCEYGCEVKLLALTSKIWFHGVHFGTSKIDSGQLREKKEGEKKHFFGIPTWNTLACCWARRLITPLTF